MDAIDLAFEIRDGGLAALFPDGEDGEQLGERVGAEVAERADGGDVDRWWGGGRGEAGCEEAGVDGRCHEGFEGLRRREGEGGEEVGVCWGGGGEGVGEEA